MRLTPAAIHEIEHLGSLRLDLAGGGCCGRYYCFSLEGASPGDVIIPAGTAALALSPRAAAAVLGSVLDYGAGLRPPRFRILRNPNTSLRCPCGRSFGQPYPGKSGPDCKAYEPMAWLGG